MGWIDDLGDLTDERADLAELLGETPPPRRPGVVLETCPRHGPFEAHTLFTACPVCDDPSPSRRPESDHLAVPRRSPFA